MDGLDHRWHSHGGEKWVEVLEAEGTGLAKVILCHSSQALSSQSFCPHLENIWADTAEVEALTGTFFSPSPRVLRSCPLEPRGLLTFCPPMRTICFTWVRRRWMELVPGHQAVNTTKVLTWRRQTSELVGDWPPGMGPQGAHPRPWANGLGLWLVRSHHMQINLGLHNPALWEEVKPCFQKIIWSCLLLPTSPKS